MKYDSKVTWAFVLLLVLIVCQAVHYPKRQVILLLETWGAVRFMCWYLAICFLSGWLWPRFIKWLDKHTIRDNPAFEERDPPQ